jgi:hypothetical protein
VAIDAGSGDDGAAGPKVLPGTETLLQATCDSAAKDGQGYYERQVGVLPAVAGDAKSMLYFCACVELSVWVHAFSSRKYDWVEESSADQLAMRDSILLQKVEELGLRFPERRHPLI